MSSIFLSHSSTDKQFVRTLARDISRHGGAAWVDEAEMQVGDSLVRKISEGIESTEFLGVVLSPASVGSEWVQREVEAALNNEINGRRVKVLPLLKRKCDIPAFLKGKIYADFSRSSGYQDALRRVVTAMGLDPEAIRRVPGKRMIQVRDLRKKIAEHFHPRKVEVELFDDASGIASIVVWNDDRTFELYSWETIPTDVELLTKIFIPDGSDQIRSVRGIEGGPYSLDERTAVIAEIKTKHGLARDADWSKAGEPGKLARADYEAWFLEASTLCLSNRPD